MAILTDLSYEEAQALPNNKHIVLNTDLIPVIAYTGTDIPSAGEINGSGQYYSIDSLFGRPGARNGEMIYLASYYDNSSNPSANKGGGYFVFDANEQKSNHNGVTIFSPTVPWDGLQSTLAAYHAKTGETDSSGVGCWVRQFDVINPYMSGAVGGGVIDDYVALQKILNIIDTNGNVIHIPSDTFLTSAALSVSKYYTKIVGNGVNASIITSNSTTADVFTIASTMQDFEIKDVLITRSVTPVSGSGIAFTKSNHCKLDSVLIEKHYYGVTLGPCGNANFVDSIVQKNISHGVRNMGNGTDTANQWNLSRVLSQMNGGNGFHYEAINGTAASMIAGELIGCMTFGNSGYGVAAIGTSTMPLVDIRVRGGFYSEDGTHEFYFDTYGKQHEMHHVHVSTVGRGATGPNLDVPATLAGDAIHVTSNNENIDIISCPISNVSDNAIYSDAKYTVICGGAIRYPNLSGNNASAIVANPVVGGMVNISAITVIGGSFDYGLKSNDGTRVIMTGCYLGTPDIAPFFATANEASAQLVACRPHTTIATQIQNGVVLGAATGGNKGAGSLNSATGTYKNNVAYTNP